MTSLLTTILPKLVNVKTHLFEMSGSLIEQTHSQIIARKLNLSPNKTLGIALILQQSNVSDFTDEEIISLSKLKLERLFVNMQPTKIPRVLDGNLPLHDTLNGVSFNLKSYAKETSFNYCLGLSGKKNVNLQELLLELS